MRLAVCALSAVLLSGCSWLGGLGNTGQGGSFFGQSSQSSGQFNGRYNGQNGAFAGAQQNPCVVYSPRAPIPFGCDPASVTIGTASGGFPQQPNFGNSNFGNASFANSGFGSHANVAGQQAELYKPRQRLKKPKLRGSLSFGFDESISGDALDVDDFTAFNPAINYAPAVEGSIAGSPQSGSITTTRFTSITENIDQPNLSFDDIHSAPFSLKGGLEFIANPRTTFFGNVGYGYAEGEGVQGAVITGELRREETVENFQTIAAVAAIPTIPAIPAIPANPLIGFPGSPGSPEIPGSPGSPEMIVSLGSITNNSFIPNQNIANFVYDFSDQQRLDLEVGARHYFNPIVRDQGFKTLTPFVGGSVGATYHDDVSFTVTQDQVFLQQAFEAGGSDMAEFFQVAGPVTEVELYDSQWVPTGQLNAGVEWQVTPKTAFAFESGLKFEGSRDFSNGESGDSNISIPFTVRGSYNF